MYDIPIFWLVNVDFIPIIYLAEGFHYQAGLGSGADAFIAANSL
jgi:hypothetical protein